MNYKLDFLNIFLFILSYAVLYFVLTKSAYRYDLVDKNDPSIKYEVKTFTKGGCNFCPSNMLGQGRTFDNTVFVEKTKKLIFCITSNIHFPEVKIKFIHGTDLINNYPNGKIPLGDLIKFFN